MLFVFFLTVKLNCFGQVQLVNTFTGGFGPLDGNSGDAFIGPFQAVAKDSILYFSDKDFSALRSMSLKSKNVKTLVSNQKNISAIAISPGGDSIFFTTNGNTLNLYRNSGKILTILDTLPETDLDALLCDSKGRLLIGGGGNRVLLRNLNGDYQTLAGKLNVAGSTDAADTLARFNKIAGLALSATEDTLYISDRFNSKIRRLIRPSRMVSTLANIPVFGPWQLAFNRRKDTLYIGNASGHTLVRYSLKSGIGTSWCGLNAISGYLDGNLNNARFFYPSGVVRTDSGLLVCDAFNRRLRQVSFSGVVKTFAGIGRIGDGIGVNSRFSTPYDIVKHPGKDTIYITDQNNHAIRSIDLRNNKVSTVAGNGFAGNVYGIGRNALLNRPINMAISQTGDSLYFTEPFSNRIKLLLTKTREVKLLAGSDSSGYADKLQGRFSKFNRPQDISLKGRFLYVTDVLNHKIRTIDVSTTAVSTFAGSTIGFKDSSLLASKFNRPFSLEWVGNRLFIGEDGGLRIRVIDIDSSVVKVWAGNGNIGLANGLGTAARFRGISKLSYDPMLKRLFVAGFQNEGILRSVGVVSPEVNTYFNGLGFSDGLLSNARFTGPIGVFADSVSKRYLIADANNNLIRSITIFPNNPPKAEIDTSIYLNEDEGIVTKSDFARLISPGVLTGDTLQAVSFSTQVIPQLAMAEIMPNGDLRIQIAPDSNGLIQLRIKQNDNGGTALGGIDTSIYYTRIYVQPVNDAPSFTIAGNDTADRSQARVRPDFFSNLSAGPWDERNQGIQISLENDQPSYFLVQPFLKNDTLQFTPEPTASGIVNVTVKVKDDGGKAFGGIDSLVRNFTILLFDPVSIQALKQNKWAAYPNPAKDELRFLNLPNEASLLTWYNSTGQKVGESQIEGAKSVLSTKVPNLSKGIYQVRNNSNQVSGSLRIVLQ